MDHDGVCPGFALLLCSAALQTTTNPPSISLPSASPGGCTIKLSDDNCPCALRVFVHVWSQTVPTIRRLCPGQLNHVRRLLCGLPPLGAVHDPHLEGVASALDAVASAFGTWGTRRDLPVRSQPSVRHIRVHSPLAAPPLHPSAVSEDHFHSMPRRRRQQVQDLAPLKVLPPKSGKRKSRKGSVVHKPDNVNEESHQHRRRKTFSRCGIMNTMLISFVRLDELPPTPSGPGQTMGGSPQVKWGPVTCSNRSARILPPLFLGKRPTIWAAVSV